MKIHILLHGYPMCGFDMRVPRDWPDGHAWIRREDLNDSFYQEELKRKDLEVCPECTQANNELKEVEKS